MFYNLCEYIKDELKELDRKAASGKLSMQELEYADKLAHMKKSFLAVDAMENPEEYYGNDYSNYRNENYREHGEYGARGRGSNARRDSMGKYATRSRMYRDDFMMGELHELMERAPDERTRRKFEEFISEMKKM